MYSGPTISVVSCNITTSTLVVQLALTNATTWEGGSLDITSSQAGVIWALGSFPPFDPSNPASDFLEHEYQGTFTIDMATAQTGSGTSGNSTGGTAGINKNSSFGGLTRRQKV